MRLLLLVFSALLCNAQDTQDATSLLKEIADSASGAKGWLIEGHSTVENGTGGDSAGNFKLAWQAPGLARYESGGTGTAQTLVVCDGSSTWTYFPRANHYTRLEAGRPEASGCAFFLASWENLTAGLESAAFMGNDTVEFGGQARTCTIVRAEYAPRQALLSRVLCIDRERRFILRERMETAYTGGPRSANVRRIQTTNYSIIRRDPEFPAGEFTFSPPEGSTRTDLPQTTKTGMGLTPPVLLERRDPKYSKKAAKAGIEGAVLLAIEIGPDGRPHNIRVLHSLDPDLDKAAVECVEGWKFRPGTKDGEPVTVAANVEVAFRLVERP